MIGLKSNTLHYVKHVHFLYPLLTFFYKKCKKGVQKMYRGKNVVHPLHLHFLYIFVKKCTKNVSAIFKSIYGC